MKQALLLVPEELLNSINEKQDKILKLLENSSSNPVTDYITEKEAMEIFKRKATWFWQMRKNKALPFSKIGKAIYYSITDIKNLLDKSKQKNSVTTKI